jgi:RNA polymerase-binding transcription factor DksA
MEDPDLDGAERDVDDVERALRRLDDGSYDTCEICGEPIPEEVLAESAAARTCGRH